MSVDRKWAKRTIKGQRRLNGSTEPHGSDERNLIR
jgi:hypothetical protein